MKHIFRVLKFVKGVRKYYVIIGLLTVIVSALGLLQPFLIGKAVDEIGKGADAVLSVALWLAFAIFLSDVLSNVLNNINGYFGDLLSIKITKYLGGEYFKKILQLPKSYFDNMQTGIIVSRLERSVTQIAGFIQAMTNNFLQFLFGTVFALIAVAIYSWQVAVLLACLYPLYFWLTLRNSPKWMDYQKKKNENIDIARGRFNEAVSQIFVVKSYVQEARELKFFDKYYKKAEKLTMPQSRHWHSSDIRRRSLLNIIFFAVFVVIFYQGTAGLITAGEAVALVLYANQIRIPIFTISFIVDAGQRAIADSQDYFKVIDETTESQLGSGLGDEHLRDGDVEFDSVSFKYLGSKQKVFENITFKIKRGEKVAFVGESGEGKSTLANLLMGLYLPSSGKIKIDAQNISKTDLFTLRSSVGAVFQQPNLFSGTVRENISYAKKYADKNEIITAAKAANAHKFIIGLNNGYDTLIGERGLKLSGGQQQRVAIARAILKNAPILILDEATSSLDSKAEAEVQKALKTLMRNRTTLIIAHRLSTIEHVDKIIVLQNGEITEQGSPAELRKSGGLYAELLALQNGGKAAKERLSEYELTG